MVNGALGIGTGSSTFIPNFNIIDLVRGITNWLNNEPIKQLVPWYRSFKGKINIRSKNLLDGDIKINMKLIDGTIQSMNTESSLGAPTMDIYNTNDDDDNNEDKIIEKLEDLDTDENGDDKKNSKKSSGLKMTTMGIFEKVGNNVIVTEIPIGKSYVQYAEFLETLKEEKKIKHYEPDCINDDAKYTIYGCKFEPTLDSLSLVKSYSLTNLVLLDENNKRCKFTDPNDMLVKWCEWRLPFYQKRKDKMLNNIKKEIEDKLLKIKFINAVIEGTKRGFVSGETVVVMNIPKDDVYKQMSVMNIPDEVFDKTKLPQCTLTKIQEAQAAIQKLYEEYNQLNNTSIKQLFIHDLTKFTDKYLKVFPEEKERLN